MFIYIYMCIYDIWHTHICYTSQLTILVQQIHLSHCSQSLTRKQTFRQCRTYFKRLKAAPGQRLLLDEPSILPQGAKHLPKAFMLPRLLGKETGTDAGSPWRTWCSPSCSSPQKPPPDFLPVSDFDFHL